MNSAMGQVFDHNMEWLEREYPELAKQVREREDGFPVKIEKAGGRTAGVLSEEVAREMDERLAESTRLDGGVILFGLDGGERLSYLFDKINHLLPIFVVERHIEVFKAVISAVDMQAFLGSGRVFLFVGEDAVTKMARFVTGGNYTMLLPLVPSLFCKDDDKEWYLEGIKAIPQIVKTVIENAKADALTVDAYYSAKSRNELLSLFAPANRKKLKVLGELSTKTNFMQYAMRDSIKGFESLDIKTFTMEFRNELVCYAHMYKVMRDFLPDVWLKINHTSKESFSTPENLITVVWMQDYAPYILDRNIRVEDKINKYDQFLLQGRYFIRDLEGAGFPASRLHLFHFASDTDVYHPMELSQDDRSRYGSDITFVANYPDFRSGYAFMPKELADLLCERMREEDRYYPDDFLRFCDEEADKFGGLAVSKYDLLASWASLSTIALRIPYLESIADMGLAVYGAGWDKDMRFAKNARGKASIGEEACRIFNSAKININMHVSTNNHNRVFDIIASGGFLLTKWTGDDEGPGGIGDLFEIGKEIEVFRNKKELREKIAYYLAHDKERLQIARRGYYRLLKDHTYKQRMQKVLDIVYQGLIEEGSEDARGAGEGPV